MRQIKNLEPRFDSIETEKALVSGIEKSSGGIPRTSKQSNLEVNETVLKRDLRGAVGGNQPGFADHGLGAGDAQAALLGQSGHPG
jgi:hypothetical protein